MTEPHVKELEIKATMSDGSTRTVTVGGEITQKRTAEQIVAVLAPLLKVPE